MTGKKIVLGFSFLMLISYVSAINDIYLTIESDSGNTCLAVDNPSNNVCNSTQYLQVDGTSDHIAYFVNNQILPENSTTLEKMQYFALTPFNLFLGSSVFLLSLIFGVVFFYIIIRVAGVRL